MTPSGNESGGIEASHIEAENVVSGVQIQGGDTQTASELVHLAQAIRGGMIRAEDIKAHNLVSGLQYISDPAQASVEDLHRELVALRAQLDQAIVAHEFSDSVEAEDATAGLATATTELAKPQPNGGRVLRKLDEVNQIITRSAQTAEAAGKLGALVIRLAPLAATLWQVARHLFGG